MTKLNHKELADINFTYLLFVWFHCVSTLFGSFNAKLSFKQLSLVLDFFFFLFFYKQLNVKRILFQTNQFNSTQFKHTAKCKNS